MAENGVIHVDRDGKTHVGVYTTSEGMVHVSYLGVFPTKSTQIGESPPHALAQIMVGELIKDAKGKR